MYRKVFIEIGKCVCLLPQAVGHILSNMGPAKLNVVFSNAARQLPLTEVFNHRPDTNESINQLSLPIQVQRDIWTLQDIMMLTRIYLHQVREEKVESDFEIVGKFAEGEESQNRILMLLRTLRRHPFISNQQIIKVVLLFCYNRAKLPTTICDVLQKPRLPNGQEIFEMLMVYKALDSFSAKPWETEMFSPQKITEHPQVKRFDHECNVGILNWLPFFSLRDFTNGSSTLDPDRLCAEFSDESQTSLLLSCSNPETQSRVNDVLGRILRPQFPDMILPQ